MLQAMDWKGISFDDHRFNHIGGSSHAQRYPACRRPDHPAQASPVFAQHPRPRIRVALANLPAVTARIRGKHTDKLELVYEIEQHVRSDNILPDGFLLVNSGYLACLNQLPNDGIALGSLVPRKDNVEVLIEAVSDCRLEMQQRGYNDLPLHVFGISGNAMPLLVAVGADTFDSASYLHQAINGKYCVNLFETVPVEEADFHACDCRICNDGLHRDRMRNRLDGLYQKDILGSVAAHNLAIQQRELRRFRQLIAEADENQIAAYLEEAVKDQKGFRKFAYKLINERIKPYFDDDGGTSYA